MKKLLFALVLLVGVATMSHAQVSTSSGLLSADAQVSSSPGSLAGVLIITNGSNDATLVCYSGTDANGLALFKGTVAAASNFGGTTFNIPVSYGKLWCDVTGTGAAYIVYMK